MHPRGLSRSRLFLIRDLGHEIVFNPLHREEFGVIEVSDHSVMRKVFEEQSDPSLRVGPDSKRDVSLMNPTP